MYVPCLREHGRPAPLPLPAGVYTDLASVRRCAEFGGRAHAPLNGRLSGHGQGSSGWCRAGAGLSSVAAPILDLCPD